MTDYTEAFPIVLNDAKQKFQALPASAREEILAQVNIAYAVLDAYARKQTDRATGKKISLETAYDTVNTCIQTLKKNDMGALWLTLEAPLAEIREGKGDPRGLALRLHMIKVAFRKITSGDQDGGAGGDIGGNGAPDDAARREAAALYAKLRQMRVEKLSAEQKQQIMGDVSHLFEGLSPSQRVELYAATRFDTKADRENPLSPQIDALHDNLIFLASMLVLTAAAPGVAPLTLGAAIGALASQLAHMILPENAAQAFDERLPKPELRIQVGSWAQRGARGDEDQDLGLGGGRSGGR